MRQSHLELCRLVAIFLVLVVHGCFSTFGTPTQLSMQSFWLAAGQSLSCVCVNLFALIAGYFSIRVRFSSLMGLLFTCLFYAGVRLGVTAWDGRIDWTDAFFVSHANWYVVDYLGLYFLSPLLNLFAQRSSRRAFALLLITLLSYEIWATLFPVLGGGVRGGYSAFSLSVAYLVARYHRLHGLPSWLTARPLWIYLSASGATTALAMGFLAMGWRINVLFTYAAPLVILASVALFLCFEQRPLRPSRAINWAAQSCLGILLLHVGTSMFPYLASHLRRLTHAHSGLSYFALWLLSLLGVMLLGIVVDQLRLWLFGRLRRSAGFQCLSQRCDAWQAQAEA